MTAETHSNGIRRIVLVDDHPIVRDGLKQMIEQHDGLRVCGEAPDAGSALEVVADQKPDLVIVDVFLDGINGIELTKMLCERDPDCRILVLSMHDEGLYAERAIRAGARGYVMKQEASSRILEAIRTVLDGDLYIGEAVRQALPPTASGPTPADLDMIPSRLSSRELSVFEAIGEGLDRAQIADKLQISIKTVETHRANIKYKLNVGTAAALTQSAEAWRRLQQERKPA